MMVKAYFATLMLSSALASSDIVSQVPAEIRAAYGSGIAEKDLAEALDSAIRSVAAELGTDAEELSCERLYSDACPEGFKELPNGLCKASQSGRCSGAIDFRGLTPGQKAARAKQCGSRFKCVSGKSHQSFLASAAGSAVTKDVINIQMEQAVAEGGADFSAEDAKALSLSRDMYAHERAMYDSLVAKERDQLSRA